MDMLPPNPESTSLVILLTPDLLPPLVPSLGSDPLLLFLRVFILSS
jgi:hypothetical protein